MTKKGRDKKVIQHKQFKLTEEEHTFLLDLFIKKKYLKISTIFMRQGIFDIINNFLDFKLSTPLPSQSKKTIGVYFYEEEKNFIKKINKVCKNYNINHKDLLHHTIEHLMQEQKKSEKSKPNPLPKTPKS